MARSAWLCIVGLLLLTSCRGPDSVGVTGGYGWSDGSIDSNRTRDLDTDGTSQRVGIGATWVIGERRARERRMEALARRTLLAVNATPPTPTPTANTAPEEETGFTMPPWVWLLLGGGLGGGGLEGGKALRRRLTNGKASEAEAA
jgi:hypothetical protein